MYKLKIIQNYFYIRYLMTRCTYTSKSFYFAQGDNTIGKIILKTTHYIWNVLVDEYILCIVYS